MGATYSGIQTAAQILRCPFKDLLQPVEGEHIRVYDAEDDSNWPDWIRRKMELRRANVKEIPVV
jgi:all-trans-retinol 13,14-reductase